MVIGIDNGNASTKTVNLSFNSGLIASSVPIPMVEECIYFNEKYYALSPKRTFYQKDKTSDDTCLVLTMFGIVKELLFNDVDIYSGAIGVELAVGLPPSHYSKLKEGFENYFYKYGKHLVFKYNDREVVIEINDVRVYPQAYSAIAQNPSLKLQAKRIIIVDIGGYTTDVVGFLDGRLNPDLCFSLENGIIILCNNIKREASAIFEERFEEDDIRDAIVGNRVFLPAKQVEFIKQKAEEHATSLLNQLREYQIDLRSTRGVFVGGGSILLKEYIQDNDFVREPIFIENVSCNAIGYAQMSNNYYKRLSKK